jgi:hypothetical protein
LDIIYIHYEKELPSYLVISPSERCETIGLHQFCKKFEEVCGKKSVLFEQVGLQDFKDAYVHKYVEKHGKIDYEEKFELRKAILLAEKRGFEKSTVETGKEFASVIAMSDGFSLVLNDGKVMLSGMKNPTNHRGAVYRIPVVQITWEVDKPDIVFALCVPLNAMERKVVSDICAKLLNCHQVMFEMKSEIEIRRKYIETIEL